ncbi:TatD family hydrolase [Rahnella sp. C60]|uniref:TatD family hydrolase n=1 Tax=Rahnella perminowiae TaxID=2816244 RepID=A0ABS6L941_9GAMM|nr:MULTISPECIES: TatD family hydrolase [Rahnella]UJD91009.1 metal-dependent hydrolase [Rahnella aquatilis]MBU9812965.1 TatD family hydrolase [Rahnella perminowiae]MBU9815965.1 TatD family hydrolase [Rahnella perminowiae]MBU9838334.1 TatD family hydrolase [Rahnella perminowiae]MCR8999856.1 TatD family hydrolase [Rahnella perminowiae]
MSYTFIDTHCHFDFPPFTGAETESLRLAGQAGVRQIIVPAVTSDRFNGILSLAKKFPPLHAALGLHPLYVAQHQDSCVELLDSLLSRRDPHLVAVGEVGLDLYMEEPRFEQQQRLLKAQFALAKRETLPVILHSRRSHDQLAAMLRQAKLPATGVVHGFAGSLSQAQAFIKLGFAIGVGGTISYERAQKTRHVMAGLPLSSLLLETDAPDMPLQGFQGQPNRPERAANVFDILCSLRSETPEQIAGALLDNTRRIFNLPSL